MATLVFDIETVGENWRDLDESTQSVLTNWVDKTARSEEEHLAMITDVQNGLGFSPLTGMVVAIALYDIERGKGAVYYTGKGDELDEDLQNFKLKQRNESEMLKEFWEGAINYDTFVTFNGRSFDVPFLWHRSAVHGITPTKNLMESRYKSQQRTCRHVDLLDELTWYGVMNKRPNLHLFCRAYGINSPKDNGVTGDDITELFLKEKFRDIALYNIRDVIATTELYQVYSNHFEWR
ncbi:hypothetical protein CL653_02875 [bacterium]|nr:hypothetical protein [bacterium]